MSKCETTLWGKEKEKENQFLNFFEKTQMSSAISGI